VEQQHLVVAIGGRVEYLTKAIDGTRRLEWVKGPFSRSTIFRRSIG